MVCRAGDDERVFPIAAGSRLDFCLQSVARV